jgi:hypothetical protein
MGEFPHLLRMPTERRTRVPLPRIRGCVMAETPAIATLQRWRYEVGELPFLKLGRRVRYDKAEVSEYLAKVRRTPFMRAEAEYDTLEPESRKPE